MSALQWAGVSVYAVAAARVFWALSESEALARWSPERKMLIASLWLPLWIAGGICGYARKCLRTRRGGGGGRTVTYHYVVDGVTPRSAWPESSPRQRGQSDAHRDVSATQ